MQFLVYAGHQKSTPNRMVDGGSVDSLRGSGEGRAEGASQDSGTDTAKGAVPTVHAEDVQTWTSI